ncbi:TolC family protein [Botrimarina sp.]|uniref:TolC family protein n=1 Tax=Botrimarina sp. TaxID=2795802 RepID=UPI0032EBBB14
MLLRRTVSLVAIVAAAPALAAHTLGDAWRIALSDAPLVEASRTEAAAAGQELLVASAQARPNASLRTGYTTRTSDARFLTGAPLPGGPSRFELPYAPQNNAAFSVRAAAPLWTAGRVGSAIAAADARHDASTEASTWVGMQTRMRVAEAYIGILQAERAVGVAAQRLSASRQRLADTQRRQANQHATDRDLAGSRLQVARDELGLLECRNSLSRALLEYEHALGRGDACVEKLVEPSVVWLSDPLQDLTNCAIACRPDLAEVREVIAGHRYESASWSAARRPQVSAEVSFDYQENPYQTPQSIGSAGVYLDWALLDGGKRRHTAEAASSRAAAAHARLRELQSIVAAEVLDAWNGRAEREAAVQVAERRVAYATEHERWVRERFSSGMVFQSECADAATALAEAQAEQFYARTDLFLAQLRLRLVAGRLTDEALVPTYDGAPTLADAGDPAEASALSPGEEVEPPAAANEPPPTIELLPTPADAASGDAP